MRGIRYRRRCPIGDDRDDKELRNAFSCFLSPIIALHLHCSVYPASVHPHDGDVRAHDGHARDHESDVDDHDGVSDDGVCGDSVARYTGRYNEDSHNDLRVAR